MFTILKSIIWLVGFVVISIFILEYFGYEVNKNYFKESKAKCLEEIKQCQDEYLHEGIDNANCEFECVDPRLILNTKKTEETLQTDMAPTTDPETQPETVEDETQDDDMTDDGSSDPETPEDQVSL